jgi:SpoVK/Ycf46/Vps4 family AAA+-type ATPase
MKKMKKAKDLKDVYNIFDPAIPLKDDYLKSFYVSPYKEIKPRLFEEFKNPLLTSENPDKFLLTGYKGCGKSTELNRLCNDEDIKKNFLVVKFSIKDVLDVLDFDYTDLLLVTSAEIYNTAKDAKIKINPKILEDIERWTNKIEIIKTKTESGEIEGGAKLDFIYAKIGSWFKIEDSTRKEIRKSITQRVSTLVDNLNRMLADIQRKRQVLIIIEDLDKLSSQSAINLFFSNMFPFLQLNCKIIFTFPFALMLSHKWGIISRTFKKPTIIPNITIHTKTGETREKGYEIMREIFSKRADKNLITDKALNKCIRYSGGVVFDFIRIVSNSANVAMVNKRELIENDDVEEVVISMRDDYAFLTKEHINKLREIHKSNIARVETGSDTIRDLIANLSVLRYYNSESWDDVHPLIKYLVK